uniref:Uncharacterized protein n=1 Tax=Arundo donax TaxID=35708 RepID=A0A0A9EPT2_ARUDO
MGDMYYQLTSAFVCELKDFSSCLKPYVCTGFNFYVLVRVGWF